MKRATLAAITAFTAALTLAWFLVNLGSGTGRVEEVIVPVEEEVGLRTDTDPGEIFQRAFWRSPSADDRIVHAERREWSNDDNGVRHWEWFLEVEPGDKLVSWLREENPFRLAVELSNLVA